MSNQKELKLTIDQFKNYIGTGLEVMIKGRIAVLESMSNCTIQTTPSVHGFTFCSFEDLKPICHRLLDLDKEIEVNGERFVPLKMLYFDVIGPDSDIYGTYDDFVDYIYENIYSTQFIDWIIIQKLFEWHFWPFGEEYFENGLVIDKMTAK